jgi:Tol biopolymer transport system component
MNRCLLLACILLALAACRTDPVAAVNASTAPAIPPRPFELRAGKAVADAPGEKRLRKVRQLTFGGENAEAYWSHDGRSLILQSKREPFACDQIFVLDLETGVEKLVSTGKGRTTCSYFLQGDHRILYASTHLANPDCPPPVFRVQGKYVWALYEGYDIFVADRDGTNLQRITDTPGYDAEATVCPVTGRIVFTSVRDGDLELYSMEPDGSDVVRLTDRVGYDGGAFYSHDGARIVLRSGFPANEQEVAEYRELLAKGLVAPTRMEITVMDRDGKNFRQVTANGKANFAPYFHPDNRRILFASNMQDPQGRDFDIFMVRDDGSGLEQITRNPTFDGFPMFSPDGRYLAFSSNRFGKEQGETNVFVAEWVERPR